MRHILPICLSALLVVILSLVGLSLYQQSQMTKFQKKASELAAQRLKESVASATPRQEVFSITDGPVTKIKDIQTFMNSSIKTIDGDISIYYKNLTTGESLIIEGDKNYYMASLYKIIVTLYILEREKNGEITMTTKVGSPSATIETALNKIITESNNEYALALAEKYGWKNIEKYIKERFALDFTFSGDLKTNVKTIGALFESISEAIELSDTESKYLLGLLNQQTRTNKLPKYLPENIYSHNKTGEFEDYSHDAGLFYTPKANYILIFMSKTKDPAATNEKMALLSKEIYTILNN